LENLKKKKRYLEDMYEGVSWSIISCQS
jgi:hypothetical protein